MSQLDRNLRTLSICYRILGGLVGLILALSILGLGGTALGGGSIALLGIAFLLLLLVAGAATIVILFEVASSLQNHESRTFCLVVAWLVCAFFPLGTVLGVLTIVQLIRPEAERAFQEPEQSHVKTDGFRSQEASPAE